MAYTRRLIMLLAAVVVALAACGSDGSTATDEIIDEVIDDLIDESSDDSEGDDSSGDDDSGATEKEPVSEEASAAAITSALKRFSADASLAFSDDEEDCLIETIADEDASIVTADTFEELTIEQQALALDAAMSCAPDAVRAEFLGGFDEGAGALGEISAEVGDCIYNGLAEDDDDQRLQIQAFLAAGEEIPAPEAAIDPGASLMAECVNFGELMGEIIGADPDAAEVAEIIDQDCLSQPEVAQSLFAAVLRDPAGLDGADIPEGMEPLFECFRFGDLFSSMFSDLLGIELGDDEKICINGLFDNADAIESMMADAGPDDAFMDNVLGCFSDENRAAFGL